MWINLALIVILLICVATDVRHRKIYNKVIFPGLGIAFAVHLISNGFASLLDSFIGFAVGLGILLIPYLMGGIGAGDVKLLAVVGAWKGMGFVLQASLYMALTGALFAICILLFHKGAYVRLKAMAYSIYGLRYGIWIPMLPNDGTMKVTFPYGVAIAIGTLTALYGMELDL